MRHVDDRHLAFVAQPFDERKNVLLARVVERRQRLVHQEQARGGEQRTADGDALLLASRQRARAAIEEVSDAEEVEHLIEADVALAPGREPAAEQEILPHGQVRKQATFLEHVADAPAMSRNEYPLIGIDQRPAVENDAAAVGPHDPGDDVDERGLARAGAAEERREPPVRDEVRIERERSEPVPDVDRETHSTPNCWPTRRANSSETRSAPIEMTIDTSVRRMAPSSPPGICVKV